MIMLNVNFKNAGFFITLKLINLDMIRNDGYQVKKGRYFTVLNSSIYEQAISSKNYDTPGILGIEYSLCLITTLLILIFFDKKRLLD